MCAWCKRFSACWSSGTVDRVRIGVSLLRAAWKSSPPRPRTIMRTGPKVRKVRSMATRTAQETPDREADLYAWLLHQANELRSRQPDFIDWSELAEELDEVVALARKETVSRLRTVLTHLLKWKYQTEGRDEQSWRSTIVRERLDLSILLQSTNLRNYLTSDGYALAYHQARQQAGSEMRLDRHAWDQLFPAVCEWDYDTILNVEFLPAPVSDSNVHSH
jgi:Domain of unknown function DUF29